MMPPNVFGLGFALGLVYWLMLAPFVLLGLAIPYVTLKMRDARGEAPDPQLGYRVGMHFFFSLGVLLVLTGLSVCLVDLMLHVDPGPNRPARAELFNTTQRNGAALIISGVAVAGAHLLFLVLPSSSVGTAPVRRTFLGWRFAICGVMMVFALTGLVLSFLLRERDAPGGSLGDMRRTFAGLLIVWGTAWLVHGVLLRVASDLGWPRRSARRPNEDDWREGVRV